jgi:hypothetical protein
MTFFLVLTHGEDRKIMLSFSETIAVVSVE